MNRKIAVIVVNWNSGDWLVKCVASLLQQKRPADKIIVVDNASTDSSLMSLTKVDAPQLEIIRLDSNIGFAAGNNVGIQRCADCEWVALLNPDAWADPGWLEALTSAAESNPDYQFFACRQIMANDPQRLDGAGDAYHVSGLHWRFAYGAPVDRALEPKEVFAPCGAAAMYRTELLREIGGFDENYFCYAEDVDLGFRLRLRGHRCLYVPGAVVHHAGSAITGQRSDFTVYHGHRNLVWAFAKNMPSWLFWFYLPQHVLLNLISIVWFVLRGQGRVILKAKWDAIVGLPRVWRQRRQIQRSRRIAPWEIRKAMAKGWWTPYLQQLRRQTR